MICCTCTYTSTSTPSLQSLHFTPSKSKILCNTVERSHGPRLRYTVENIFRLDLHKMQSVLRAATRTRTLALCKPNPSLGFTRRPQLFRSLVTKRYTAEHEVVAFDDSTGIGTVSITDHAQSVLGDVVFVELPALGTEVTRGEEIGAVESVKAASDIYAPVSGRVEEINEVLSSQPNLLNKSAENKGWLCKIKLSDPSEMDKLLTEEAYKASTEV